MLPATSKELVEARYGRPITKEEYEKAVAELKERI